MTTLPTPSTKHTLPVGVSSGYHWVYFAVFALLLVALAWLTLNASRDKHLSDAQYQNSLTTSAGAEIVNRLIENIDTLFPGINDLVTRIPATLPDYDAQIRGALLARKRANPHFMDLLLVDGNGLITHWTGDGQPPPVADRAYVRTHTQGEEKGQRFVGRPQLSKVHTGKWFFAVSRAIHDENGELQRILVAIIDIGYLHSALLDIERVENGTFVVGSRSGQIYSRVPGHEEMVGRDVPALRRLSSQTRESSTSIFTSPLDHIERIVSVRQTRDPGLLFISSLAVENVLAPWYREVQIALLGLLSALILVGGLTFRLRRGHRTLIKLSTYDDLTGLLNRSTFMGLAERELRRIQRYPASLSAILIDLDDFKKVNDQYGHRVGDNLIRALGQLLIASTRDCDLSCRYGGEEFLLLLPHTGLAGARELAEKLRQQIGALETLPQEARQPSGSIGVAELQPDETLRSLVHRADQAMYRAKQGGKNRVECCQALAQTPVETTTPGGAPTALSG